MTRTAQQRRRDAECLAYRLVTELWPSGMRREVWRRVWKLDPATAGDHVFVRSVRKLEGFGWDVRIWPRMSRGELRMVRGSAELHVKPNGCVFVVKDSRNRWVGSYQPFGDLGRVNEIVDGKVNPNAGLAGLFEATR